MLVEPSLNWVRRIWHKTDKTISVSSIQSLVPVLVLGTAGSWTPEGFQTMAQKADVETRSESLSLNRSCELHSSALPGHRTGAVLQLWANRNLKNGFQVWKILCRKEPLTDVSRAWRARERRELRWQPDIWCESQAGWDILEGPRAEE